MGCLACSTGLTGGSPEIQDGHTSGAAAGPPEPRSQAHPTCPSGRHWRPWAQTHRICDAAAQLRACLMNSLQLVGN